MNKTKEKLNKAKKKNSGQSWASGQPQASPYASFGGSPSTAEIMRQSEESAQHFQKIMDDAVKETQEAADAANNQVEEELRTGKITQAEYDAYRMQLAQNEQAHQMTQMGTVQAGMQQRQQIVSGYAQDLQNDQLKMAGLMPEKNVNGVDYYYDSGISKASGAQ